MKNKTIRIGTRGSPLALRQTQMVCTALQEAHPGIETETVVIKTDGDWSAAQGERRLSSKIVFTRKIEEQLAAGKIDMAVHSMKDVDSALPEGLVIDHILPREDVRDCLLFADRRLKEIPQGAHIGTASVRRQAFLASRRPDLKFSVLRGNVQTRIDKIRAGQVEASLLALAGLKRLGLEDEADMILEPEEMLPCAGQGAIGIQIRKSDVETAALLAPINCRKTLLCVQAERGVLAALGGDCHTPVGVYALFAGNKIWLRARLMTPDGSKMSFHETRQEIQTSEEAHKTGYAIGKKLKIS